MYGNPIYIGVDIHKNFSVICVMEENGRVIEERKVKNGEIERTIERYEGRKKIIIEPTTVAINVIKRLRKNKSNKIILSHPYKTRLIAESKKKTDKIDAKILADLARTNFLPKSYMPNDEIWQLREVTRERLKLKKLSTAVKNRIHAILMKEGINYPPKLFTEKGKRFLKELNNRRIECYLNILSTIEEEIKKLNLEIKEHCKSIKETVLLTTIPGIGYYSALLIYAEIGDISRFISAKKLCSYAGLVPSVRQSGDKTIIGKITKNGNSLLRWILVQCAFTAVRVDPYFKAFYERIKTKSCSQKAVVATARKLLTIIYAILKQNKPYISPLRLPSR